MYICKKGPDCEKQPHGNKIDDSRGVDFVVLFGEAHDLGEGEEGGEDGVVGEEEIVQVDLARLVVVDEVSIAVVDGVEGESGEVHGYEVEVHALDTEC